MGIMIHSLVIGLTLAIASGADFSTSSPPSRRIFALHTNHNYLDSLPRNSNSLPQPLRRPLPRHPHRRSPRSLTTTFRNHHATKQTEVLVVEADAGGAVCGDDAGGHHHRVVGV